MQTEIKTTLIILGFMTAAVILAGCGYVGRKLMATKPLPHYIKLSDFTNDTASARLIWPSAEPKSFNLLLAISMDSPTNWPLSRDCPCFVGTVLIRGETGKEIGTYDINSSTSQHCNWLTQYSLDAFITGWQQTNCLKTAMQAIQQYEIIVNIPARPKEFSSLWLGYVSFENDQGQTWK